MPAAGLANTNLSPKCDSSWKTRHWKWYADSRTFQELAETSITYIELEDKVTHYYVTGSLFSKCRTARQTMAAELCLMEQRFMGLPYITRYYKEEAFKWKSCIGCNSLLHDGVKKVCCPSPKKYVSKEVSLIELLHMCGVVQAALEGGWDFLCPPEMAVFSSYRQLQKKKGFSSMLAFLISRTGSV